MATINPSAPVQATQRNRTSALSARSIGVNKLTLLFVMLTLGTGALMLTTKPIVPRISLAHSLKMFVLRTIPF